MAIGLVFGRTVQKDQVEQTLLCPRASRLVQGRLTEERAVLPDSHKRTTWGRANRKCIRFTGWVRVAETDDHKEKWTTNIDE